MNRIRFFPVPMSARNRLFVLTLISLVGCAELSGEGDVISSTYETFDIASEAGALESGWLPRALPVSARNIVETHNVDTSEMWSRFRYSDDDIEAMTKQCHAGNQVEFPSVKRTKRDAAWWPHELTKKSDQRERIRWTILACPSMRHAQSARAANIAFDPTSRTAWYWFAQPE